MLRKPIVRPRARIRSLRPHHLLGRNIRQLGGARARLRKGIVASDAIKRSLENTKASQKTSAWLEARTDANPL